MFKATELDQSTRTGQGSFRELRGVCLRSASGVLLALEGAGERRSQIMSRKGQQERQEEGTCGA